MSKFTIYNEDGFPIGTVRKAYPINFVDPKKEYEVSYLAPHQSKSGNREEGNFTLKGEDLTENQIWQLFLREAL